MRNKQHSVVLIFASQYQLSLVMAFKNQTSKIYKCLTEQLATYPSHSLSFSGLLLLLSHVQRQAIVQSDWKKKHCTYILLKPHHKMFICEKLAGIIHNTLSHLYQVKIREVKVFIFCLHQYLEKSRKAQNSHTSKFPPNLSASLFMQFLSHYPCCLRQGSHLHLIYFDLEDNVASMSLVLNQCIQSAQRIGRTRKLNPENEKHRVL